MIRRQRQMKQKLVSLRVQEDEYEALNILAKREVRTISSWVRVRIVMEAIKAGLISSTGDSLPDNTPTEKEAN
jgi:predicted DNA-binding protein